MESHVVVSSLQTFFACKAGKGIGIRINDDGVDHNHPELSSKFDLSGSCTIFEPALLDASHGHGTACASLAAASGNNTCAVGIAPDARVSGCRIVYTYLNEDIAEEVWDSSYLYAKMETMHISSNSYGTQHCASTTRRRKLLQSCPFSSDLRSSPCLSPKCANVDWSNTGPAPDCEGVVISYCKSQFENDVQACTSFLDLFVQCHYGSQSMEDNRAFTEGITNGRNGLGIIYVFSAGNAFALGDDVNFDGALNSRYIISVGAVGKDVKHSSYSTSGAPLFISAPGGDFETRTNNIVADPGGGCTDAGVGTSFACPVISGVVALMLEVNRDLSWRDVQGILATTAQKVYPLDSSWTTNAAGLHHSYLYGFGVVDAHAAVEAAKTWIYFNAEQQIIAESGTVDVPIPEFQIPSLWAESQVNVTTSASFVVESVYVYLDLKHSSRGDLDIVLVSPQGTASLLAPGERPENAQLGNDERWKLMTVRNWGETANGNWTLRLIDRRAGDIEPCVDFAGWDVTIATTEYSVTLECWDFKRERACVNGGPGPLFSEWFEGENITDPVFTNENGVSLVQACCACGGGLSSSAVPDVLKSWRLAVYGRDSEAVLSAR
jgi:subtilisin-like proprotein convertase family protein